jgi:hypothetical protein
MAKKTQIQTGQKFNRLTIIKETESAIFPSRKIRMVECICDCGNIGKYQLSQLSINHIVSCGCYGKEKLIESVKISNSIHNDTRKKGSLYGTWQSMKSRCYRPNATGYERYGGRGIKMYETWKNSYVEFKKWIINNLGERPDNHSLDRIDNSIGYFPNNIRWASSKQQANNRRKRQY